MSPSVPSKEGLTSLKFSERHYLVKPTTLSVEQYFEKCNFTKKHFLANFHFRSILEDTRRLNDGSLEREFRPLSDLRILSTDKVDGFTK